MFKTLVTKIYTLLFTIPFFCTQELYPLTVQLDVEDVLFKDELIYFVTNNSIKIFDPEQRSFLLPLNKPINSTISISNEKILICAWENLNISDPKEYSTIIHIYNIGDNQDIFTLQFHETLKTTNCSIDTIYLESSVPQLEQKYFRYDISSNTLTEEKKNKEHIVNKWENIYSNISVRKNSSGILWIYRKILKF